MVKKISGKLSLSKEADFFEKKNQQALERLKGRKGEGLRPSPITGNPMEKEVFHGVVIDRCADSGGIWLDAGELEEILEQLGVGVDDDEAPEWIVNFFKGLTGKH